jgi:hypothetical protein
LHIYAFGSVCRGDITPDSDIDLLAIVDGRDDRFDAEVFSIYAYKRVAELWEAGNAFAWHLHFESKLIYADDGRDNLADRGSPSAYTRARTDCARFKSVFENAYDALRAKTVSSVFELSSIFLSIRNLATCYSLGIRGEANFGRDAAIRLGRLSVPLTREAYEILRRARFLSTRGLGAYITRQETERVLREGDTLSEWVEKIAREAQQHG